ncbi:endonuclease MutS2 [Fusibacter sp. JL298sf-3]
MDNTHTKKMLDWAHITDKLIEKAVSEEAKVKLKHLAPVEDLYLIENMQAETTEARRLVDQASGVPLHGLSGVGNTLEKIKRGEVLRAGDFWFLATFIKDCTRMKRYMYGKESDAPKVSSYALSIDVLDALYAALSESVYHDEVLDSASQALAKIRRKRAKTEQDIKNKLQGYLVDNRYQNVLSETVISQRDGRYVIPVKSEHKKHVGGQILDRSRSGGTLFIEPAGIKKLHDALSALRIQEESEVYRILSELSNEVAADLPALSLNYECMVTYDVLFAKAKLSKQMNATAPAVNTQGLIAIRAGRHPLLGTDAVPLNLTLEPTCHNLVITGPNTGGKTVTMKTVGLFCMMAQSGLHLPCDCGTTLPIFSRILCDIGDGQSVEQNLSTFSSHITNINRILAEADDKTLVILDEIGSGTDPSEGMGIGIAVLEALEAKGAYILASTHYGEIKRFASEHPKFVNGSMGFDIETLSPLYQLTLGAAGESSALHIALRLGMPKDMIERAHELAYNAKKRYKAPVIEAPKRAAQPPAPNVTTEPTASKAVQKSVYAPKKKPKFAVGDNVWIHTMKRSGIVVETENSKGEVTVQVLGKKIKVNHKRLSLNIKGDALYPDAYDMDIVTKSKDERKTRKALSKGKKDVVLES